VLPVLACEEIVIGKEAELGAAGINEKTIDQTLRRAYTEIAERRRTLPTAVALGLLDKDLAVYQAKTPDGLRYELEEGVAALREAGKLTTQDTFFQPGEPHLLSGAKLRDLRWATHLAEDRRELSAVLALPLAALQQDLTPEDGWKPLSVELNGPVHRQAVNWILKSLDEHQRRGDFNLLILQLNTAGGDLDQSRRLATHLVEMGQAVHTVAFVDRQARGDAALIALACDELVVNESAVLGGPGEAALSAGELVTIRTALPEIFEPLGRDWSLPLALIDPQVEVHRYRNPQSGEVRYLGSEEIEHLQDAAAWQRDERPMETSRGLTGAQAEELGLARQTAENFEQLKTLYQLTGELPEARPNWALAAIEWLADPRIAGVLLFVGWFALMFEMSTPGVSVPGFIAVICFLLYFWSQFLHGTAGWLEILLFVGGIVCLSIEIFALPGFGVFGVGGALMVISSIVLASQTFVVPTNAYQLRQFPVSLLMVAAGMSGGIASIYVIRRFLPDTPYFNRMLLAPPPREERAALSRREAMVSWEHLLHKRGVTATPLVPAGKAQFGDELVDLNCSDRELSGRRVISMPNQTWSG
jgi:membrane-bound ClpP family serine protease